MIPKEEIVFCKDCRHRDPEDKKCDCGCLERQGCFYPVADDYFCKFGAREYSEKLEVKRMAENKGDLIGREYVEGIVEELENICINGDEYILTLLSNIKNAPPVEEKSYAMGYQDGLEDGLNDIRPQGKWICEYRTCKCSVCGFATVIDTYNFCPNCGADMRGKEE